jgi:hypothetical protein
MRDSRLVQPGSPYKASLGGSSPSAVGNRGEAGAEAIEFFKQQSKDKLPGARLFTEDGETPWRRHVWARQMQAAIARHNEVAKGNQRISSHATAYSFRDARISELLQIYGVDPLTVAAQTGRAWR